MEFIRGLGNIRERHRGCVATIGNFDGVHLGHQSVIRQLRTTGQRLCLPATAILFEPQPIEFFLNAAAPARLTRWREKVVELCKLGVERILCLRFDKHLAAMPAEEFVADLLVSRLGVRSVVVGDDFHFGKDRRGNFQSLQALGPEFGFVVERTDSFLLDGERASSTRIRNLLAAGEFEQAGRLLGRAFAISGHVVYGQGRGRTIGFATANINLGRHRSPVHGIFAARAHGIAPVPMDAVAYVGNRPIVGGVYDILEVHIFDFAGDCYGKRLDIELVAKLRDDRPFTNFEELRLQITEDVQQARNMLKNSGMGLLEDLA